MKLNRITTEQFLYILAFLLALAVRLISLGRTPLSDAESGWALQALSLSKGQPAAIGPQPGSVFLTGLVFTLFGASNFAARLWPALAGALLVLLPAVFRRQIGRGPALILAYALALDPGLVAVSRIAGSSMLAVGFGLLAIGLAYARQPILAGIFGGLALLSGPAALQGLLGILLAWLWIRTLEQAGFLSTMDGAIPVESKNLRPILTASLLTILVAGTALLIMPQGLGAWLSELPAYLSGWIQPTGVPALRLMASLAIYQPLAVLFGLVGIFQVWKRPAEDRLDHEQRISGRRLTLWLILALGIALLYPSRQMSDLVWVLVPLWALAAIGLYNLLKAEANQKLTSLCQAILLLLLFSLVWMNLAGITYTSPGTQVYTLRLGLVGGVFALAVLTTLLVALGWSWQVARRGLVWGLCAALGLYGLSAMVHSSLFNPVGQATYEELWNTSQVSGDANLLLGTLGDLSGWHTGFRDGIDVTVNVDAPSLRWALRNYSKAQFLPQGELLPKGSTNLPSILITRQSQQSPSLAAAYRGQDFVWWNNTGWTGILPPDFIQWWVFQQAPVQQEQLILWARSDLFAGGGKSSAVPQNPSP